MARIAWPPADRDLLGVHRVAVMKSAAGRSAGAPENRLTARSNEPHQALTGAAPRHGARSAPSTSAAAVAARMYSATWSGRRCVL